MKIEALHLGMKVRHPQYGVGTVKTIAEHTADVRFETGERTVSPEASGLEPAEAQAAITGLEQPLSVFIKEIVRNTVDDLAARLAARRDQILIKPQNIRVVLDISGGRVFLVPGLEYAPKEVHRLVKRINGNLGRRIWPEGIDYLIASRRETLASQQIAQ